MDPHEDLPLDELLQETCDMTIDMPVEHEGKQSISDRDYFLDPTAIYGHIDHRSIISIYYGMSAKGRIIILKFTSDLGGSHRIHRASGAEENFPLSIKERSGARRFQRARFVLEK